jgi:hypothetical protein
MPEARSQLAGAARAAPPLVFLIAAAAWLAALPASAAAAPAVSDVYVGVGAGIDRGRVDCIAAFTCDRSSTSWKLTAGARVGDAVDMQAILFDAGRFRGGDTTPLGTQFGGAFKATGFAITAGHRWDVGSGWSAAARAGAAAVRTRFSYADPFSALASVSKTTLQPIAGAGLAFAVTPTLRVGIDYDVTRFKVHTTRGSLQLIGVAAQLSF